VTRPGGDRGTARTVLLLALVGVFLVVVYGGSVLLSTTRDRPDQFDGDTVPTAAARACRTLVGALATLPPLPGSATPMQRADRAVTQDAAVRRLVADVGTVGPDALRKDSPGEQWLADWTRLADGRDAAAAQLRAGRPATWAVPVEDEHPISDRMGAVGVPECAVPRALTSLP
jgi:hypothetical protein